MNYVGLLLISRLWTWRAEFITSTQRLAEQLIHWANFYLQLEILEQRPVVGPCSVQQVVSFGLPPRIQPAAILPGLSVCWKVVAGSQEGALCVGVVRCLER